MARRPRSELELLNAPITQDPEADKVSKQIDDDLRVRTIYAFDPPGRSDTRPQKEADRLKRKKTSEVKGARRCVMLPPFFFFR